jgi:signal transduction histidine kinase
MKRRIVAVGLAVAALALLAALVFQSRPVPVEVHLAHHTAVADLERVAEDFKTLVTTLESAWQAGQPPGEGARALAARVAVSPERIQAQLFQVRGGTSQEARVRNSYEGFTASVEESSTLARDLLEEQSEFAASVNFLRESGPQIVEMMRDISLNRAAADTFQLLVGALDFARADATVQEYELRRLLVTLGRDQRIDANMPGEIQALLGAVTLVLEKKSAIQSRLRQIAQTPVPASAGSLSLAAEDLYRNTLSSVDQGRTLLAVYAVLLLAAAGFITVRLNQSYRDLNRANSELANMNVSLEQRVSERTDELEGTLHDLKESQVQLVQAEKMSSLGQLVAGISHEINTPLLYLANNSVLIQERLELMEEFVGSCVEAFSMKPEDFHDRSTYQANFVESLKKLKLKLRDDEIEASLGEAIDLERDSVAGLNELTEMAQSLKDFSRLDRAPIESFDVSAGLDKTLLIARNALKHKANVRKFYGKVPEIECSPSQINQVFLNILTNAAQAIEDDGEIVITSKLRDPRHIAVTIADTGCGIPRENLGKIRDPFFTTKEVGTGTGLGLSIVDEIVRAHGGELLVESELGKGSAFTIVLPIKQAAQAPARPDATDDAPEAPAEDGGEPAAKAFAEAV